LRNKKKVNETNKNGKPMTSGEDSWRLNL